MIVSTGIAVLNRYRESTGNYFSTWFKGNELAENAFTNIPKEIIETIFTYLPGQIRLTVLPLVCQQFYPITRPFYKKCFDLHPLFCTANYFIQKRDFIDNHVKYFHILNFKENRELSIQKSRFATSCDADKCTELFQSGIQSYISTLNQDDKFDILPLTQHLDLSFKHSWTENRFFSKNVLYSKRMDTKSIEFLKPFVDFLCGLDDQSLVKIAEVLSSYKSKDLIKLINDGLACFENEERKKATLILKNLMHDQPLDLLCDLAMLDPRNFEAIFNFNLLDFTLASKDKCFEKLKTTIDELSKAYDYTSDQKNCLFIIDKEVKGYFASSYKLELIYSTILAPEYQWFADKLLNK